MLIAVTNPTPTKRKAPKKAAAPKRKTSTKPKAVSRRAFPKVETMAKRKKARKVSRRRKVAHKNPTPVHHYRKARKRRVHRNPSAFGGGKGILKELLSMEGALMIGAAFAAPMVTDYAQEKLMPSASGWTKIAVKAALVGGVAWLLDKYGKQRKAALAYAVTGAAVLASDAVRLARGQMAGLSDAQADYFSTRPELADALADYQVGMADYQVGMADASYAGMDSAFSQPWG